MQCFYSIMRLELAHKGISITSVSPAGVDTPIMTKEATTDKRTFATEKWIKSGYVMPVDRCARLMLIAGSNRFGEVLVGRQPQLFAARLFDMFGGYIRPVLALFMTQSTLKQFQESILKPKNDS